MSNPTTTNYAFPKSDTSSPDHHKSHGWSAELDAALDAIDAELHTLSTGGGGGTPAGSSGQIQYNNAGAFAGIVGSAVDLTHGNITIAPTAGSGAAAVTITANDNDGVDINSLDASSTIYFAPQTGNVFEVAFQSQSGSNYDFQCDGSGNLAFAMTSTEGATVVFTLQSGSNSVALQPTTISTVGEAGGASALPDTPDGYLVIAVNGVNKNVPYYAQA